MRLLIFGVTGGTGARLLQQALAAGHEVTAVARDPGSVGERGHDRLTVLRGDVLEPGTWRAAVPGHDAVLSCLGSTDRKHPTTVYSQGSANILEAMRPAGARRFVCLSSAGLEIAPGTPLPQRLVTRFVIQRLYRHGYADMAEMERLVRASDADWTVIRPPMLTDGPLTGRYRTAIGAPLPGARSVARADLADCVLSLIDDRRTWRAVVEISG
ncbi:NAD(P)-dependent oxidoreductase [Sphaerisporangium fuscum]|uniref:NAD(P)-dependent oxidoreductase n=1 Tax=Sphaerisporangium fuscum TaxID=2835868 RepID=UPI001BDD8AD7|nr:SDR family oxidoreductase [Sphaerisporangium fuscum]